MNNQRRYMLWLPVTAAVFLIAGLWLGRSFDFAHSDTSARAKLNEVFDII